MATNTPDIRLSNTELFGTGPAPTGLRCKWCASQPREADSNWCQACITADFPDYS